MGRNYCTDFSRFWRHYFGKDDIDQAGEEYLGGVAGQRAVAVDDEGNKRGIGDEGFGAAVLQILLAEIPFEAGGERDEILDKIAVGLRGGKHFRTRHEVNLKHYLAPLSQLILERLHNWVGVLEVPVRHVV